ncbi:MAG: iron-containing alcohol dehydrogenase PsrA [Betaproteobacteria bacterium]
MSATWQYHNPVAVHFGWGGLDKLPALLGDRRAVLVTFPEAAATGLRGRIETMLGGRLAAVIDDVQPNPELDWVSKTYKAFWRQHPDCVVLAVGGGSVLDSAKMLLPGVASGDFAEIHAALAAGKAPAITRALPLIAVPTTAGTGSEVTPWATLWDRSPAKPKKYSLHLNETWPEAALVDPELTLSLPAAVTRNSGLDALSHALESIWNVNCNPVSDALAVEAARTVIATLPALLKNPGDNALRSAAARASLHAGLAFSNTKTALAHSISYDMTLLHGLPHGLACSFTLPMVWRLAQGKRPDRDAVLARVFGHEVTDPAAALEAFLGELGVDTRFSAYGVTDDAARGMMDDAMQGPRGRNFVGATA